VRNLRYGHWMLMAAGVLALGIVAVTAHADDKPAQAAPATPADASETISASGVSLNVDGSVSANTVEMASVYRAIGLAAAAAFVTAVSIVGSGYAVGRIGSAALGAAAEKPELLVRSLAFVALAEGLAVLGFAMAFLLLQKI